MNDKKSAVVRYRYRQLMNVWAAYGLTIFWVMLVLTATKALLAIYGLDSAELLGQPPWMCVSLRVLGNYSPSWAAAVQTNVWLYLFLLLVFAPVFEEIVFRLFFMTLVQWSRPQIRLAMQLAVCGILFGILHGGPWNVFVQGVLGFILARLYVANCRTMFSAWFSCALVHFMYNLSVLLLWG